MDGVHAPQNPLMSTIKFSGLELETPFGILGWRFAHPAIRSSPPEGRWRHRTNQIDRGHGDSCCREAVLFESFPSLWLPPSLDDEPPYLIESSRLVLHTDFKKKNYSLHSQGYLHACNLVKLNTKISGLPHCERAEKFYGIETALNAELK